MDRAALERVLLAVKVLHSSLDPVANVTPEDIRRLRCPDDDSELSNREIALLAIRREVKREKAIDSADELASSA